MPLDTQPRFVFFIEYRKHYFTSENLMFKNMLEKTSGVPKRTRKTSLLIDHEEIEGHWLNGI